MLRNQSNVWLIALLTNMSRDFDTRNYQNRSDEYKAKRKERDHEYRHKKRQNETEEERQNRLIENLYYYSDMSYDKYFAMHDKRNMERRLESKEV